MKKALVFGASGQVGSYIVEFLVKKGCQVVGTTCNHWLDHQTPVKILVEMVDLRFPKQIEWCLERHKPDEVYNLAAKMFAPASWENPTEHLQVNALAVGTMLDALFKINPDARFFQAGSAEIFGRYTAGNLTESWPMPIPRSPYGVAKLAAQELVRVYREEKRRFACTGICFNIESPRRADSFFSVKVAKAVAAIAAGKQEKLKLGKLHARRDWGYAPEYVEAMWLMLQAERPRDYVIATGETHSCYDFVVEAFKEAGVSLDKLEYDQSDEGECDVQYADPNSIRSNLGWQAKTKFKGVIKILVETEMAALGQSTVAR